MKKPRVKNRDITELMDMLASKDGMLRQKARESLVTLGEPAVPSLIQAMQASKPNQVRWEAAKALGAIGDARSIPALVTTLEDTDSGVAWLAAEALGKFNKGAWAPLLRALIKRGADSLPLRQGAHHVLRNQEANGFTDALATVIKALESDTVPEMTPVAANNLLKRMKAQA